jgi:peptidoglycan hydrolase-like amidase
MALLVKWYTLFYLWGNRHPSVPEGVSYQAIDDPRLFQKYVGAWIEQTTPRWQQALEKTLKQVIVYDWYLPILPFFHCSAWFIRSGNERFWRTDTPWLVSKLDLATCESGAFEWHGVGLSGDGAEKLAKKWALYQEILRYYYPGIKIATLP